MTRQTWTAVVSGSLFVLLAALIALIPVPFVTWSPGESFNALGNRPDGTAVIDVQGLPTYRPESELLITTVKVTRAEARVSLPEAVLRYLQPNHDVLPRDAVYPVGTVAQQVAADNAAEMDRSQRRAVVAALSAAGVPVVQAPQVSSVVASGPSNNVLRVGDFINRVDGVRVSTKTEFDQAVAAHDLDEKVHLTISREGQEQELIVRTVASNTSSRTPRIGVDVIESYQYEPEVKFRLEENVTGPSAGLVFAIGVYDLITPEGLVGDVKVAGTGQIDASGAVSSVAGVSERIKAAENAGAAVFLLPAGNCPDLANVETPLELVKVTNLGDAITSLKDLQTAVGVAGVPRC